jgi:hypothetical protein
LTFKNTLEKYSKKYSNVKTFGCNVQRPLWLVFYITFSTLVFLHYFFTLIFLVCLFTLYFFSSKNQISKFPGQPVNTNENIITEDVENISSDIRDEPSRRGRESGSLQADFRGFTEEMKEVPVSNLDGGILNEETANR